VEPFFDLFEHLFQGAQLVSATAAGNLVSAIWEGAVLAAAVGLCLRILPRLSAASRSLVWLNVFVLLALLHILPAAMGHKISGAMGSRSTLEPGYRRCVGAPFPVARDAACGERGTAAADGEPVDAVGSRCGD
jgi:hypothetical protein